jgi:hypothetical protein
LAEEGSGESAVKTEKAIVFEDVYECTDHRFGRIAAAGLEADLFLCLAQIFLPIRLIRNGDRITFTGRLLATQLSPERKEHT